MSGTQQDPIVILDDLEYDPAAIYDYKDYEYNRWENSSTSGSPSPSPAPTPQNPSPAPYIRYDQVTPFSDSDYAYEYIPKSPRSPDLEPWGTPLPDTPEPESQIHSPSPSASLELIFREEADIMACALISHRPLTLILDLACGASGILSHRPAIDFALEPSLWQPHGPFLVRVRVDLYITRHKALLLFLALWILSRYL